MVNAVKARNILLSLLYRRMAVFHALCKDNGRRDSNTEAS